MIIILCIALYDWSHKSFGQRLGFGHNFSCKALVFRNSMKLEANLHLFKTFKGLVVLAAEAYSFNPKKKKNWDVEIESGGAASKL